MALYSLKKNKSGIPYFRPTTKKDTKKAIKRGKDVIGKIGRSSAPKGYYQSGTTTRSNKAGTQTYAIYSKLPTQQAPAPTPAPAPAPTPSPTATPQPTTVTPDTPVYEPQFDTSGLESQISGLNSQISSLTSGFQNQLGALQTQMQQEREAARLRMEEMQGSFAQALSQRGERPRVEGIRFAGRGTGGATQQQLQRRGVRGTFGRAGERLMKISSLNV